MGGEDPLHFCTGTLPAYMPAGVTTTLPGSRGCGTRQRILHRCRYLILARVNTHGLTDDPMMVLPPMHLEAELLIDGELHERHRRKERKHHGCCRRRRRAFIAGDLLGGTGSVSCNSVFVLYLCRFLNQ